MNDKYTQMLDGRESRLKKGAHVEGVGEGCDLTFACCDCGLVHQLFLKDEGDYMLMLAWRDQRRTGQRRRRHHPNWREGIQV